MVKVVRSTPGANMGLFVFEGTSYCFLVFEGNQKEDPLFGGCSPPKKRRTGLELVRSSFSEVTFFNSMAGVVLLCPCRRRAKGPPQGSVQRNVWERAWRFCETFPRYPHFLEFPNIYVYIYIYIFGGGGELETKLSSSKNPPLHPKQELCHNRAPRKQNPARRKPA